MKIQVCDMCNKRYDYQRWYFLRKNWRLFIDGDYPSDGEPYHLDVCPKCMEGLKQTKSLRHIEHGGKK